jgi:quinol-cytochrome oxidoreductase complex cytochrome b subunit
MTPGTVAMLVGLFVVPALLLWLGHRLRRRSARQRAVFWGMLWGYVAASIVALVTGMMTPAMWAEDDTMRGLLGFWSLVVLPVLGAAIGAMRRVS